MDNNITLKTGMPEIEASIIEEDNIDELNEIIDVFNINLKKKDIVRSSKLSEIQDKVVQQMYDRLDKRADELSTGDLINLHKVVQDTLSKTDTTLDGVKIPSIQINQQVNINNNEFDRDSRVRILDAISSILNAAKSDIEPIDVDYEEEQIDN